MAILTLLHNRCQEKIKNSEFLSAPQANFFIAVSKEMMYNKGHICVQETHEKQKRK